jgi:hypothetical protein
LCVLARKSVFCEALPYNMLALCFADDARVHDENSDYRGLDAIRAWKQETDAKYRYVMEPLDASISENTVKLRARLTGSRSHSNP